MGSADEVEEFRSKQRTPPTFDTGIHLVPLVLKESNFNSNTRNDLRYRYFVDRFNGARAYAIYGWFQWVRPRPWAVWHNIFRVKTNEKGFGADYSVLGDRTFALWVHRGFLYFNTYAYDLNGRRLPHHDHRVNVNHEADTDNKWIFFYMGYSHEEKRVKVFVKFEGREHDYTYENT